MPARPTHPQPSTSPSARRPGPTSKLLVLIALVATGLAACSTGDDSSAADDDNGPTQVTEAQAEQPTEPPLDDDGDAPTPTLRPPDEADVAYGPAEICDPDDQHCAGDQTLDIYRSTAVDGVRPVVVWIHGGGFVSGDKSTVDANFQTLLDNGWDVVAIDYRLTTDAGDNRFPVPVRDSKRAIRWIRANAAQYRWDTDRIAAVGHSAGGNLVGVLAAHTDDATLEPNDLPPELAAQSSAIAVGVALTPVSDLRAWEDHDRDYNSAMKYLGCLGDECDDRYPEGSVPIHINASSVPLLAIFGNDDQLAPPTDGQQLAAAYRDAGIADRFEYVVVDDGPEKWRGHNPDLRRLSGQIRDFINDHTGRP